MARHERRRRPRYIQLEKARQARLEYAEDFDTLLHLFLRDCTIRNLSPRTIDFYRREVKKFRRYLDEAGHDTHHPSDITDKQIKEGVILRMMQDKAAESAINATLRASRTFFSFLERESFILRNPFDKVKQLKEKKTIIQTFTREQLQALLRKPDLRTFTGLRDYTIMLFFIETGVRVSELVNVKVQDVHFKDNQVRVLGKGYKERLVPMQALMKRQLNKYMTIRGELKTDALFVNIDNEPLSVRQVQQSISQYGKQAGIKGVRVSPHTFRHTFARMAVENGADAYSLRAIMGHTTFEMTNRYVNLFGSSVRDMHKKYSPVESIGHMIEV